MIVRKDLDQKLQVIGSNEGFVTRYISTRLHSYCDEEYKIIRRDALGHV